MAFDRTAWFVAHKEEKRVYDKQYRIKNHGKDLLKQRAGHLRRKYGMAMSDYDLKVASQGNCCAICGGIEVGRGEKYWHVDHDHKTGKIRGLLCYLCNVGLGSMRDNISILTSAIDYLRRHA